MNLEGLGRASLVTETLVTETHVEVQDTSILAIRTPKGFRAGIPLIIQTVRRCKAIAAQALDLSKRLARTWGA